MKIVIDISEETIRKIKNELYCGIDDPDLYKAMEDGKLLPKGHGRLIDADALLSKAKFLYKGYEVALKNTIGDAPTIIEADTEADT